MPNNSEVPVLTPWFQVYPDRFTEEKDELEAMGFILDEMLVEQAGLVAFSGVLLEYPDRRLTISFPGTFPSVAPKVRDDGECAILPRHQKADGRVYCIFGPETKNWYAALKGVDALVETRRLIDFVMTQNADSKREEDPYPEPYSAQPIFAKYGTILVPPGVSDFLPEDLTKPCEGFIKVKYEAQPKGRIQQVADPRGIVVDASFKGNENGQGCTGSYLNILKASEVRGRLTYIPKLNRPIYSSADFAAVLRENGLNTHTNYDWHALVFPEDSGDRIATRYSWLVFKKEANVTYSPVRTVTYRSSEREARVPGLRFLAEKRIALIGCGSIGSKVAAYLAASGASRLLLIDKESLEPANSVRHECGVDQFGLPKAKALAARLLSLNPDLAVDCQTLVCDPFGELPLGVMQNIYAVLANCDLFINATGHTGIPRAVNEFSKKLAIPSVHVSVTNGAWSGEVVRYLPGKTACWLCFQELFGEDHPPGSKVPNGHVFGPGCDQPTFTGTSYDLGIVAGLAAGFVIDTLRVADGGISEYLGDYVLWEGRDANGRLLQRTSVKVVPPREKCSICGGGQ